LPSGNISTMSLVVPVILFCDSVLTNIWTGHSGDLLIDCRILALDRYRSRK
jgi:hypothetical protein